MTRTRIHTRTIVVDVYDEGDGTVSIEGRLEDRQPPGSGYFKGRPRENDPRPPGVLHGMSARIRVDRKTSEIVEAHGEFPARPYRGCAEMLPWLSKLNGLKVAAGYTQKARERLGGPNGCAHMNSLLQVLANTRSAANAYFLPHDWVQAMATAAATEESYAHPALNSCHMWRESGPLMTALSSGKSPIDLDL